MTLRMIARGRHLSSAVLVWSSALLMCLADGLALASIHGTPGALRVAALAVATLAGFLLGTALLRAIGSLVAHVRIRQALAAHDAATAAHMTSEVARGIAQIEAFLAEQHSRDA